MNREDLLIKLGKTGKQRVDAAVQLVAAALAASDRSPFVVAVSPNADVQPPRILVTIGNGMNTSSGELGVEEVKELAASSDAIAILALHRAVFGKLDRPPTEILHKQRRALPGTEQIAALHANMVSTERTSSLLRRLDDSTSVRLVGQSASGKTVTAAQVASSLLASNWTVSWIDLSDPSRDSYDLLLSIIRTTVGRANRHLVVVDDAQANPGETKRIGHLIDKITASLTCPIDVLVLSWESGAQVVQDAFPNSVSKACYGDNVIPQLAREIVGAEISDEQIATVRETSAGDLFVTRLMLGQFKVHRRLPSTTEIASLAFEHATGGATLNADELSLLYRLSALSQLEIDIARSYAESFGMEALERLLQLRSVRQNGDYLSIGHRSLARMMLHHLRTSQPAVIEQIPAAGRIAVDYVRGATPQQIVSTLQRLDVAGLAYESNDQHGTTFLAKAWESLIILVNYLAKQARNDSTWGDNTASSIFAAEALAEIGNDAWDQIASSLHSRWTVPTNGQLIKPVNGPTADRVDFDEIQKTMSEVEAFGDDYPDEDRAANVDYDRMHGTWTLGLLLGFEGTARRPRVEVLNNLKLIAQKVQAADGSFYPKRVPWVTARVLIGLAKAGESIRTNTVVKQGCDWLRRAHPDGPYRLGTWESGTGTWNTTLGTTSMCVNALVRCGVPVSDPCVNAGTAYLISKRDEWVRPGQEIDGAFAMETVLAVRGRWREISGELAALLSWVRDREPWAMATQLASESHDESCKVSQIASSLIGIVWDTVKAELPLLLEGIATTVYEPPQTDDEVGACARAIAEVISDLKNKMGQEITARQDIEERVGTQRSVELTKQLSLWRDRRTALRALEGEFARLTQHQDVVVSKESLMRVAEGVNEIGRDCLPGSWIDVHVFEKVEE